MAITYTDISQKVKKKLWVSISTEAHQESEILSYINDSISMMSRERQFPYEAMRTTFTIVSPNVEVVIPETFSILWIKKWSESIKIVDRETYYLTEDRTGIVGVYNDTAISETIGDYEMMYMGIPTLATTITHVYDLPSRFTNAIVYRAVSLWAEDRQDGNKSTEYFQKYQEQVIWLARVDTNKTPRQEIIVWRAI